MLPCVLREAREGRARSGTDLRAMTQPRSQVRHLDR
jgi:hypothetical protein